MISTFQWPSKSIIAPALLFETRVSKWSSVCLSGVKRNFAPKAQNSAQNSRIQYKVLQNSRNFNKSSTEEATDFFRRFINASKHRLQCLLALSYFNIDFQEILKIHVFFWNQENWTVSRFPVFGSFLATFFRKKIHRIVLGKKSGLKKPNIHEANFAPKAQNLTSTLPSV